MFPNSFAIAIITFTMMKLAREVSLMRVIVRYHGGDDALDDLPAG